MRVPGWLRKDAMGAPVHVCSGVERERSGRPGRAGRARRIAGQGPERGLLERLVVAAYRRRASHAAVALEITMANPMRLVRALEQALDSDDAVPRSHFVLALDAEPFSSPGSAWAAPGRHYPLAGVSEGRASLLVAGTLATRDRPSPAPDALGRGCPLTVLLRGVRSGHPDCGLGRGTDHPTRRVGPCGL